MSLYRISKDTDDFTGAGFRVGREGRRNFVGVRQAPQNGAVRWSGHVRAFLCLIP